MKRTFLVTSILIALLCAPSLFACAECDTLNGKPSCAWGVSSGMGSCWVKADFSDCRGTFGCDDSKGAPGADPPVGDAGWGDNKCGNPLMCPPEGFKY